MGNNASIASIENVLFADQFAGADIGAQINAAIATLPPEGGKIVIAPDVYTFSTQIQITKPVHLDGLALGSRNQSGTVLKWSGGASAAIVVDGTSGASTGSILENFDLYNNGSATVGIDIFNGQYDVVLRNVALEGTSWSVAGVRVGNNTSGSASINIKLQNVRIAGGTVGLQVLFVNAMDCYSCSIYNTTTCNVQIGDSTHQATNITFYGGNIEQDLSALPSVIVNNVQGLNFFGVYTETITQPFIEIPNTATEAHGVTFIGGRCNAGGFANSTFLSVALSTATIFIGNTFLINYGSGSAIVNNISFRNCSLFNISTDSSIADISINVPTGIRWENIDFAGVASAITTFPEALNGSTAAFGTVGTNTTRNTMQLLADAPRLYFGPGSSHYNFKIANQDSTGNSLEISVGVGGQSDPTVDTYTPIVLVNQNRTVTLAGALEIGGATPTGTSGQLGLGTTTGFGNGTSGTAMTTTTKNTGAGPTAPQTIKNYLEIDIGGTKYWIPLVQ